MQIKPIRNEADYEQALRRVEALWGAAQATSEGDELDILVSLIEAYEQKHFPIDLPDPIDAIKFRLEQTGKDLSALIGVIGQRTRVYEVIRRDRPLSLNMIRKLNQELAIPAEILIQPLRKAGSPKTRPRLLRQKTSRANLNSSIPADVSPDVHQLLLTAIFLKRQIRFLYDGNERIAEPHDYGIQKGHTRLFAYQISGYSIGQLPDWRMFDVSRISKLEILAPPFPKDRKIPSGVQYEMERTISSTLAM
jgi:HTH-type transcriptional regulator/antitoxin HigA